MAPDRHDQLDDIEDQLAAVTGGGDGDDGPASPNPDPEALDVEWRNADPEHRPEGVSFDPDSGTLTYDVWSAQQDALDALNALAVGSDGDPTPT